MKKEDIKIAVGQEYFCRADDRTRKVVAVTKTSVTIVCLDCLTIPRENQAMQPYADFVTLVHAKNFVLKAELAEPEAQAIEEVKAEKEEVAPIKQNPAPSLFD